VNPTVVVEMGIDIYGATLSIIIILPLDTIRGLVADIRAYHSFEGALIG
jgi:hypothetical protein